MPQLVSIIEEDLEQDAAAAEERGAAAAAQAEPNNEDDDDDATVVSSPNSHRSARHQSDFLTSVTPITTPDVEVTAGSREDRMFNNIPPCSGDRSVTGMAAGNGPDVDDSKREEADQQEMSHESSYVGVYSSGYAYADDDDDDLTEYGASLSALDWNVMERSVPISAQTAVSALSQRGRPLTDDDLVDRDMMQLTADDVYRIHRRQLHQRQRERQLSPGSGNGLDRSPAEDGQQLGRGYETPTSTAAASRRLRHRHRVYNENLI